MVVFVIEVCPIASKLSFIPSIHCIVQALWNFRRNSSAFIDALETFSKSDVPIGEDPACPGIRLAIGPRRRYYLSDRSHRCCRPLHPQG